MNRPVEFKISLWNCTLLVSACGILFDFWLGWIFATAHGPSPVVESRGYFSSFDAQASHCGGFSCAEHQLWGLWAAVVVASRLQSVQSLSRVRLFATPWTAARQASLSITNSQSLLKLMSIESVMPSNHLIPFSSHLESFPARGSFQMSQFFTSGGQSIGVSASASVLPVNN